MPITKEEARKLLQEIKKTAKPFTGHLGGGGGGYHGGGGGAGGGGGGGGANPQQVYGAIKEMQKAMQTFAQAVVTYSAPPKQPGQGQGQDQGQPQQDSKKPFNDFIIEQYVSGSDIKGEEYSADPRRTSQQQKEEQATDLLEMNIVVDGLKRIGSPQSELIADNVWDFRTNNALKNVYAFAYGLVKLSEDFGRTNVQSFSEKDLQAMAALIPADQNPSQIPGADKMDKAKQLTPLIQKLTRFYRFYVDQIATHPAWTRYIGKDEPMMTLQKGGGDPTQLSEEQQQMMSNVGDMSLVNSIPGIFNFPQYALAIPTPRNPQKPIGLVPLDALQDPEHFSAWLQMSVVGWPRNQANDPRVQKQVLDAIKKHIDAVIALAKQQQTAKAPAAPQQQQAGGAGEAGEGQPQQRGVRPGGPGPVSAA